MHLFCSFGRDGEKIFVVFFGLVCVANSLTHVRVEQRLRLAQNLERRGEKKTSGSDSLYSTRQRCVTAPHTPAKGHTRSNIHIYVCIFRNVSTSAKKQETRRAVLQNFLSPFLSLHANRRGEESKKDKTEIDGIVCGAA